MFQGKPNHHAHKFQSQTLTCQTRRTNWVYIWFSN
jgi:hypothetical protein